MKDETAQMAYVLKLEEIAMTAGGIYLLCFFNLGFPLWIWLLLFFAPDISMLGYLINNRIGALTYNVFHHRGLALVVVGIGLLLSSEVFTATGLLLFAHSSFDRMMGYGLKYNDSFQKTSLGWIGKKNS